MNELTTVIQDYLKSCRLKTAKQLRTIDPDELAYKTLVILEDALGKTKPEGRWTCLKPLTNLCSALGTMVLRGLEHADVPDGTRNKNRFKTGWVLILALVEAGLLEISRARPQKKSRNKYQVKVKEGAEDTMEDLLFIVDTPEVDIPVYTRPQFEEPMTFIKFYNPKAGPLVRNVNPEVKQYFTMDNCPRVFEVINKHMSVAYNVNREVLDVYLFSQEDPIFTFENKMDLDETQLAGLERERDKVLEIAEMVGDRKFWEYMFYDNRGRLYSSAVYLTHAGSKLSKSLFLYNEKKALGSEGYFWLLVHTANTFGFDKATIDERFDYAEGKLTEWMEIAKDPVNNKLWQDADSPYEFLAAIMEIKKAFANPGGVYAYESGLPIAWDATCSGLQVLSALSRDEISGELCNLTETDKRGDYYKYIADHVWQECVYTDTEERIFNKITEDLSAIDRKIKLALQSRNKKLRTEAFEEKDAYFTKHKENITASAKVYWGKLYDKRRKICKRPCMTYFYSCQDKTMAKAVLKDHGDDPAFKGLNYFYAKWLTSRIYNACRELMKKPTELMDLFIDLGVEAYKRKSDFIIDAPVTNFKLMQYYREDKTEQVRVKLGDKHIKPVVVIGKNEILKRNKVMSATSPNVVHMLDSQIVAGVILKADYTVSCIHDSFSTHAADGGKLFHDCREVFVEIFDRDILTEMLDSLGLPNPVQYGSLDLNDVFLNDYNFS